MRAGGDLRHDAAEGGMVGDLRQHHIGQNSATAVGAAFDDRRGGLVAAGLDAEDNSHDTALEVLRLAPGAHERSGKRDGGLRP